MAGSDTLNPNSSFGASGGFDQYRSATGSSSESGSSGSSSTSDGIDPWISLAAFAATTQSSLPSHPVAGIQDLITSSEDQYQDDTDDTTGSDPWEGLQEALRNIASSSNPAAGPRNAGISHRSEQTSSGDKEGDRDEEEASSGDEFIPTSPDTPVSVHAVPHIESEDDGSLEDPIGLSLPFSDMMKSNKSFTVFYLADPHNWDPVRIDIPTLDPNQWLGGSCIEFYLLLHWLKKKDTAAVWYMTQAAVNVCSQSTPPSEEDLNRTRDQILWKDGDPERPVSFIKFTSNHYFAVVLDYRRDVVYVFGRSISKNKVTVEGDSDWKMWNGPEIWKNAAALYGWDPPDMSPGRFYYINWLQVK